MKIRKAQNIRLHENPQGTKYQTPRKSVRHKISDSTKIRKPTHTSPVPIHVRMAYQKLNHTVSFTQQLRFICCRSIVAKTTTQK